MAWEAVPCCLLAHGRSAWLLASPAHLCFATCRLGLAWLGGMVGRGGSLGHCSLGRGTVTSALAGKLPGLDAVAWLAGWLRNSGPC